MSEPITYPAPVLEFPPPPQSKWEREYRAFLQMLPQLLQTHRGQFVAVHDGQVVGSGEDKVALALGCYAKYGYVPIYVGLVAERPLPPERIPHYRILSPDPGP